MYQCVDIMYVLCTCDLFSCSCLKALRILDNEVHPEGGFENEFIKVLIHVAPFDVVVAGARDRSSSSCKIQEFQSKLECLNKGEKFISLKAFMGQTESALLEIIPRTIDFMEDLQILLRDIPGKNTDRPEELLAALTASLQEVTDLMSPAFEKTEVQFNTLAGLQCTLLQGTDTTGPDGAKWKALRQENSMSSAAMGLRKCIDMLLNACKTASLESLAQLTNFDTQIQAVTAWMDLTTAIDDLCTYDQVCELIPKDSQDFKEASKVVGEACKKMHAMERAFAKEHPVAPLICAIVV